MSQELPMVGERCSNCRFWLDDSDGVIEPDEYEHSDEKSGGRLACHRYPPIIQGLVSHSVFSSGWDEGDQELFDARGGIYPLTWSDDWCGEWQAKKSNVDVAGQIAPYSWKEFCAGPPKLTVRAIKAIRWAIRQYHPEYHSAVVPPNTNLICELTSDQLLECKGCGNTGLSEIQDRLARFGLQLKDG